MPSMDLDGYLYGLVFAVVWTPLQNPSYLNNN